MLNFIEELSWRGMLSQHTSNIIYENITGYVGFDPTAPSLQIGNLAAIMLLVHFQRYNNKPIVLVGGATGMIGDPSGKNQERNLLTSETVEENVKKIKLQLSKFLDFDESNPKSAKILNNYDWFSKINVLDFLRDIGKHININYMLAKDSVQNRLETGLSFTEFSYQLFQGWDFHHLNQTENCVIQMGGSDQFGNMVTGTELIRKISGNEVGILTCPLVTKADGTKFGKSSSGDKIWLDKNLTSPYKFYQFWLNTTDEEVKKYIRIFTLLGKEEIESLEIDHFKEPHLRILQNRIADEVTKMVHSEEDLNSAKKISSILFGSKVIEDLDENDIENLFNNNLPIFENTINGNIVETLSCIFESKSELRRMISGNGISINKKKIGLDNVITEEDLIVSKVYGKFLLVGKGKKDNIILKVKVSL